MTYNNFYYLIISNGWCYSNYYKTKKLKYNSNKINVLLHFTVIYFIVRVSTLIGKGFSCQEKICRFDPDLTRTYKKLYNIKELAQW